MVTWVPVGRPALYGEVRALRSHHGPFHVQRVCQGFPWLGWDLLSHYPDDFILVVPNPPSLDATYDGRHVEVTGLLGIPCKDSKDIYGTVLPYSAMRLTPICSPLRVPDDKLVEARMPPPKLS